MLSGKFIPQNLRALRILVEELLRHILPDVALYADLERLLDDLYNQSPTAKLWVTVLIKPILLC